MNEQIKFRAWVPDAGEMHTVSHVTFDGNFNVEEVAFNESCDWDEQEGGTGFERFSGDVVLQRFTGVTDKKGEYIFEGDIVVCKERYAEKKFVVEYRIDSEFIGFIPNEIGKKTLSSFVPWNDLEVIGNIYENENLLKTV